MKVVIIKYNSGNVSSVAFALQRLGIDPVLSDDKEEIQSADKVIFPGVGHAAAAMQSIKGKGLDRLIVDLKQPFLGICAGMQLMCAHSEEGNTPCLGIVPLRVRKFTASQSLKVPHTGWNTIANLESDLLTGVPENAFVYFVHSYCVAVGAPTIAVCEYGEQFSAAIRKNNFYGVQFHTERSAEAGSRILSNFLKLA